MAYDKQMLKDILDAHGACGREKGVRDTIKAYIAPHADEVYRDAMGNLIAVKKGTSGKKIMFTVHMDQIGFLVRSIGEDGFVRLINQGCINSARCIAREIRFENGARGVTYFETADKTVLTAGITSQFVDVGASTKEEAEAIVKVGESAVFASDFVEMGSRIACGALDNRICCAAMVEMFRAMQSEHDVYAVFTVQEEEGMRGASPAAFGVKPDLNITVDVTGTDDAPGAEETGVDLGKGPAVKVKDMYITVPEEVIAFLENAAKKANIKYQYEFAPGYTDAGPVQRTGAGILSGGISVPLRYLHTPVETVDVRDYEETVRLLCAVVAEKELPQY